MFSRLLPRMQARRAHLSFVLCVRLRVCLCSLYHYLWFCSPRGRNDAAAGVVCAPAAARLRALLVGLRRFKCGCATRLCMYFACMHGTADVLYACVFLAASGVSVAVGWPGLRATGRVRWQAYMQPNHQNPMQLALCQVALL